MKKCGIIPFREGFNLLAGPRRGDPELLVELGFLALPGKERCTSAETVERAFLLLKGEVVFRWGGRAVRVSRGSWRDQGPYCLHVPAGMEVRIDGMADHSELTVHRTENMALFPAELIAPEDVWDARREASGPDAGRGWNTRTVIGPGGCPASRLILGETVLSPGHWSGPPEGQRVPPETALFKFYPQNGFGLVKADGRACLSTENTVVKLRKDSGFQYVGAPGYWQYCVWCARDRRDGSQAGPKTGEGAGGPV